MYVFLEVVFFIDIMWDVAQFDADVLWSIQRVLEEEVFDVKGDKLGAFSRKDDVEEEIDEVNRSCFGANVTRVGDVMHFYSDASAVRVCFFGAKHANNLGESDAFAEVQWNVFVSEEVECVGAIDALFVWVFWVGVDALSQASRFFGVGLVTDWFKARMAAECAVI